ncbi:uncharacterized protein L201_002269 [Kwoniella dendrophila CBS 6074]|uniref:Alpha/beta hydrolase fold-3 domain-containing protein n=1 Tax=Kwoniella dendrophila CBS 6074 TaxID=1295534 RepID=A0AAX4JS96_9TREE
MSSIQMGGRGSSTTQVPQPLPVKHLLENYTTAHPLRSPSPLPSTSRVDPNLPQRLPKNTSFSPLLWTFSTWWLFIRFLLLKGIHIYFNLLSHFLFGPKRKSWGYRMTFITSFMRNIADHSSLADIVLIRKFISLQNLIFPLPFGDDAVVTPITFKVPSSLKKGENEILKGFMREFDLNENGQRDLSGEWVVGTDVWKRLKAERRQRNRNRNRSNRNSNNNNSSGQSRRKSSDNSSTIPSKSTNLKNYITNDTVSVNEKSSSSSPTSSSSLPKKPETSPLKTKSSDSVNSTTTPTTDSESDKTGERVIYYVHGGAYYVGNAATHRLITIGVSKSCNARVFAITYRLAPEHVFPLPLHDVLHGYLRLLAPPLSIPPENIIIAGDSAGGGLSLALCMYLRDEGYKLPAGLVLMSPWVDLTMSCGSWDENAATDVVPRPEADDHLNPVGCYLGPKGISTYLTHPYASPLFGDLSGLPPMLIQSGDSEVLRDEITLLAHKATLAGVHVTHELYEDMVHVFQMFSFLPATTAAINNVGRWVCQTLPLIEQEQDQNQNQIGKLNKEVEDELELNSPRLVARDGEEISSPQHQHQQRTPKRNGNLSIPTDTEIDAVDDYRSQTRSNRFDTLNTQTKSLGTGLRLDIGESDLINNQDNEQPNIDVDSLTSDLHTDDGKSKISTPRARSRSITPTPNSRTPLHDSDSTLGLNGVPFPQNNEPFSGPHTLPRLRRSVTNVPSSSSITPILSPSHNNGNDNVSEYRRKRRTTYSLHVSPAQSIYNTSNPTSPTPSIRRRLRGSSIMSPNTTFNHVQSSSQSSSQQSTPSTRARSKSHSDIFHLVEGYVEGGAANTTTVIDPEGEIRSMGILGEDENDF